MLGLSTWERDATSTLSPDGCVRMRIGRVVVIVKGREAEWKRHVGRGCVVRERVCGEKGIRAGERCGSRMYAGG